MLPVHQTAARAYGESIISVPPGLNGRYLAGSSARTSSIAVAPAQPFTAAASASGSNLGSGAQIYAGASNGVLFMRSLVAGSGVAITQDAPAAGDILIGAAAPVADLALFVNAVTGSDATGTGTPTLPFQTLERAAAQVRATGWDGRASITIQTSTPPLELASGYINLSPGPLGKQVNPLVVQGEPLAAVGGPYSIATVAIDRNPANTTQGSNMITVTVAGSPFAAAQVGQVVRFTTGSLAAYSTGEYGAFPAPLQQVEAFIGGVPSGNTLQLCWAAISATSTPAAGNQFVVLSTPTSVAVPDSGYPSPAALTPSLYSGGASVVIYNLNFVCAPGLLNATLQIAGSGTFYMNCVTLTPGANASLYFNVASSLQASTLQNTFGLQGSSTAGLCLLASAANSSAYVDTLIDPGVPTGPTGTISMSLGDSVAIGSVALSGNISYVNFFGNGSTVNGATSGVSFYFTGICTVMGVLAINLQGAYLPFIEIAGTVGVSSMHVQSVLNAVQVTTTGKAGLSTSWVEAQAATGLDGIVVVSGGLLTLTNSTLTGVAGTLNGVSASTGLIIMSGVTSLGWGLAGILIQDGSIAAIDTTTSAGLTTGIMITGSTVNLDDMVIQGAGTGSGNGLDIAGSVLTITGNLMVAGWAQNGELARDTVFTDTVGGVVSFSACGQHAISMQGCRGNLVTGTLTGGAGTGDAITMSGSILSIFGPTTISGWGGNGITANLASNLSLSSVIISGCAGNGVSADGNTNLGITSLTSGSANTGHGVVLRTALPPREPGRRSLARPATA